MMDGATLFEKAAQICESTFRPQVPYTPQNVIIDGKLRRASTGNMRFNATSIRQQSQDRIIIKVDARIAPYVVYTNEPWLSPKWNGAKNPNEGWFQKAVEQYTKNLAASLGGTLTRR